MNYYLHRISYEWDVSYALLDQGYLSIRWGWLQAFEGGEGPLAVARRDTVGDEFREKMNRAGATQRNKWSLWYFAQFKKDDLVVVPLFGGQFTIVRVVEPATSVLDLPIKEFKTINGEMAGLKSNGIWVGEETEARDIGYVVKVEKLRDKPIDRSYADAGLVARMKVRQTTVVIDDVATSVEQAIQATGPIDLHEKIAEGLKGFLQKTIDEFVTPEKLERVVEWYMKKQGATRTEIPSKNDSMKSEGADADVIAVFEKLRTIYLIQVKKHGEKTNDWAVRQIDLYKGDREKEDSGAEDSNYTYIPWVISTADEFSVEAQALAKDRGVRLIGRDEFCEKILDCGIDGIDQS